ncbi:hypothetical protein [Thermomonospora umbrina]|uniref:Homogentisate 1,2-dioxygenase n=1 Tax=Thermomonospora umbrina TaxID=111806 RepID=A0A3D9SSX3_9ACTN|nr:hypothetical protein [Thermomonospora umbrina]REE95664.1 hypothetical protein DFJ69_1073 [Thermomonospora umbrina]
MGTVHEHLETFPFDAAPRVFERKEELLLAEPLPAPIKRYRDHPPIEVVHFTPTYVEQPFAHPRGVYESEFLRVEWQTMNNRQPFYHRNCDVDEMSYQVCGERTLMTDLGTAELRTGDFSRLPVGCAHDNYGREDIHLLFYTPAPVAELISEDRRAGLVIPAFPGWEAETVNELITECLGGPGNDIVMAPADERLILEQVEREAEPLKVLHPEATAPGTTWLYRSGLIKIGRAYAESSDGRVYRRVRNAEEIQYQISGHRTLVTQRGTLLLEPGDFVRIPVGVAFTSIHPEPSAHITLSSAREVPQVSEGTRRGERLPVAELDRLREGIGR